MRRRRYEEDLYLFRPDRVQDYDGLKAFFEKYKDAIISSIDQECVDHLDEDDTSPYERLSEVGMSWYDPLDDHSAKFTAEKAIRKIKSFHCIIRKWKNFTDKSCLNKHRRDRHKAMPYKCYFARSYICNRDRALGLVMEKLKWLSTKGLSKEDVAAGKRRKVVVLYWDARLETSVFAEAGLDITAYGAEQMDFQLLHLFFLKFRRTRNRAQEMFQSLGVGFLHMPYLPAFHPERCHDTWRDSPETGFEWHNATNDSWATVAGFLQILSMATQKWKWKRWMVQGSTSWGDRYIDGRNLKALDMSWLKPKVYQRNAKLSPPWEKWPKLPKDRQVQDDSDMYSDMEGMVDTRGGY